MPANDEVEITRPVSRTRRWLRRLREAAWFGLLLGIPGALVMLLGVPFATWWEGRGAVNWEETFLMALLAGGGMWLITALIVLMPDPKPEREREGED